jgi:hypothetical protein
MWLPVGRGGIREGLGLIFFFILQPLRNETLEFQRGSSSSLRLGRNGSSSSPIQLAGVKANAKTNPIPKKKMIATFAGRVIDL